MAEEIFFFISPLLIAGLIHHFIVVNLNLFPYLKIPIDLGFSHHGRRVFGESKTLRGFVIVMLLSGLFSFPIFEIIKIDLKAAPFTVGLLLGFGYSLGELPTSFIKRRLGIKPGGQRHDLPGKLLYILEQTDSIFGALVFATFFYNFKISSLIWLFLLASLLHASFDLILHWRGYKRSAQKPFFLKN